MELNTGKILSKNNLPQELRAMALEKQMAAERAENTANRDRIKDLQDVVTALVEGGIE